MIARGCLWFVVISLWPKGLTYLVVLVLPLWGLLRVVLSVLNLLARQLIELQPQKERAVLWTGTPFDFYRNPPKIGLSPAQFALPYEDQFPPLHPPIPTRFL